MDNYRGYLAFGKLLGYHRELWIDIPQDSLIRFHQHEIIPPLSRNLQLDDPCKVRRFNTVLHKRLRKNNLYSCITVIHQLGVYPLPGNHARAFESFDNITVKITHKSDKKCRRKITGKVRWSPYYEKAMELK